MMLKLICKGLNPEEDPTPKCIGPNPELYSPLLPKPIGKGLNPELYSLLLPKTICNGLNPGGDPTPSRICVDAETNWQRTEPRRGPNPEHSESKFALD